METHLKPHIPDLVESIHWDRLLDHLAMMGHIRPAEVLTIKHHRKRELKFSALQQILLKSEIGIWSFIHALYNTGQMYLYRKLNPLPSFPELAGIISNPVATVCGDLYSPVDEELKAGSSPVYEYHVSRTFSAKVKFVPHPNGDDGHLPVIELSKATGAPVRLTFWQFQVFMECIPIMDNIGAGITTIISSLGPETSTVYGTSSNNVFTRTIMEHVTEANATDHVFHLNQSSSYPSLHLSVPYSNGIYLAVLNDAVDDLGAMAACTAADAPSAEDLLNIEPGKLFDGATAPILPRKPDSVRLIRYKDGKSSLALDMEFTEVLYFNSHAYEILHLLMMLPSLPMPTYSPVCRIVLVKSQLPVGRIKGEEALALEVCLEALGMFAVWTATRLAESYCGACYRSCHNLPEMQSHVHMPLMKAIERYVSEISKRYHSLNGKAKVRSLVFGEATNVDTATLVSVFERFCALQISDKLIQAAAYYYACLPPSLMRRALSGTWESK